MVTYSGIKVNLVHFKPYMVSIEDIAHALSKQCRFNGHINRHFSVAEHCLVGSHLADSPALALEALLHDSGEAYTGDIIIPFKEVFPEICEIEDAIAGTIFETLWPDSARVYNGKYVKSADMSAIDKYMGMCESMQFRPHIPHYADQKKIKPEVWQSCWHRMMQANFDSNLQTVFVERFNELIEEISDE